MTQNILVLVRHGESEWNRLNLFTGWRDPDLTDKGVAEAKRAGQLLKAEGFKFDIAFTSVLKRAQRTLSLMLAELGQTGLETVRDQALNERDYGELSGLNKDDARRKWGDEQVLIWRRSFDVPPPPLEPGGDFDLASDRRYAGIAIPTAESLKDTIARVLPYWEQAIAPELRAGKRVIIAAHGNSLRALVKHLSGLSDDEIVHEEIPTGQPMVYDLADDLTAISRRYL